MIESYDRPLAISNSASSSNCPTNEYSYRTASNSVIVDQKLEVVKKIICRYGRGCTHMHDACHRLKFWHPSMPALTGQNTCIELIPSVEVDSHPPSRPNVCAVRTDIFVIFQDHFFAVLLLFRPIMNDYS